MISGAWVEIVALVAAFAIATVTTPAGVSGAVLLLPFQVSVLGTPSPAVTPTNLLYNVVASPGAIWRYWQQGRTGGNLSWLLPAGTLPGVIGGLVIRVYLLPGPVSFFALAPYIAYEAISKLAGGEHPATSWLGIGLAVTSLIIMPFLGTAKKRLGARLHALLPETTIRRLLALAVVTIGIRYMWLGLTGAS